jgi:two-component sensor histidine kinase
MSRYVERVGRRQHRNVITNLLLGGACLAIVCALMRRSRSGELSRAHVAGMIFVAALGAAAFVDAMAANDALASALRAIAAVAGITTAAFVFSLGPTPRRAAATTTPPAVSRSAPSGPAPSTPTIVARPSSPTPMPDDLDVELAPEAGFLGLVSHELRTPLTAMQLLLDRLGDASNELSPRHQQLVERLASTATRLTDLVDSILYYARLRSGRLVTCIEPFDLGTLATDVAEELRPQAERKALDLEASGTSDHVSIESDPKLLRLVIVNLVSNAVKFTHQGKVAVSVSAEGDHRIVRVTDSGSGIAADEQQRIFEPFQNIEPTKHKHLPGIGLGLSLARQIVDNLGGQIAVRSELGKGSTFEVSLPAVARSRAAPVAAQ